MIDNPAMGNSASTSVGVTSLNSEGLELISPVSPEFDSEVRVLVPKVEGDPVLGLKPFLAILSNRSRHTIVAFATIWEVKYKGKGTERTLAPILFPDAVAGIAGTGAHADDREAPPIASGEQRLIARETQFGAPGQKFTADDEINLLNWIRTVTQDQKAEPADVMEVQIILDAAIFSDGLLVGPNSSNLDLAFMSKLEAKQTLFRQIVSDLDDGRTVEEAFKPAKTLAMRRPVLSQNHSAVYETVGAQEIIALRRRIGDSAVHAIFSQAIRKEPFMIRRASGE